MHYKHYDSLKLFTYVARYRSFSEAAASLHLSKGAISHQMKLLESSVGFELFHRQPKGISLTNKGEQLLTKCDINFSQIEELINELKRSYKTDLTLGVTTYFASRWLSQRLMNFMQSHPGVRLRLQPMADLSNLSGEGIDLAIRWGKGGWKDMETQLLFRCPAWPCGNQSSLQIIGKLGLEKAFEGFTLLHDRPESDAWKQWYEAAGINYPDKEDNLIIPDPNVRVEAVINSQGIALNDALVSRELQEGRLHRLSETALEDYGYYLAYSKHSANSMVVEEFINWISHDAINFKPGPHST